MKLRYKKAILLSLLSTLGMGILTLSVNPNHSQNVSTVASQDKSNEAGKNQEELTPSPTVSELPAQLPVFSFEKDGNAEITELINKYYKAKLHCDRDSIKSLLTDTSQVASQQQLKKNISFIEGYKDIKCYVKKSFRNNEYIVFVYQNIKFYNINTTAPALDEFYVVKDLSGKMKIFSDDFDEKTKQYYRDRINDEDVVKLIKETNNKITNARKKDKKFKEFYDGFTKKKSS